MDVLVRDYLFEDVSVEQEVLEPLGASIVVAPDVREETLVGTRARDGASLVCFAPITSRVIEAAAAHGCRIIERYRTASTTSTSTQRRGREHATALLLAFARDVVKSAAHVRLGGWSVPYGRIHRLRGRRLALFGVGRIGRRVTERALSFGPTSSRYRRTARFGRARMC